MRYHYALIEKRTYSQSHHRRLAVYVQVLESMQRNGVEVISSGPLAEACDVNASQVRKDLAYFGEFGVRGVGTT